MNNCANQLLVVCYSHVHSAKYTARVEVSTYTFTSKCLLQAKNPGGDETRRFDWVWTVEMFALSGRYCWIYYHTASKCSYVATVKLNAIKIVFIGNFSACFSLQPSPPDNWLTMELVSQQHYGRTQLKGTRMFCCNSKSAIQSFAQLECLMLSCFTNLHYIITVLCESEKITFSLFHVITLTT